MQKELHEPNAYIITLNGARRLLKLTNLWKINRSIDKQIFNYIQQKFLRGYIIKKQFLYSSNIKYKHIQLTGVHDDFVKTDGLTVNDVEVIENELNKYKKEVIRIVKIKDVVDVVDVVDDIKDVIDDIKDVIEDVEDVVDVIDDIKDVAKETEEETEEDKYILNIANKLNSILELS